MAARDSRSRRLLLLAAVLAFGRARGTSREEAPTAAAAPAPVKDMTVPQLAEALKAGSATVFDANTEDFRKENGTVPGAVLLTSSSKYALSQLPADKHRKLVFYCTSRL